MACRLAKLLFLRNRSEIFLGQTGQTVTVAIIDLSFASTETKFKNPITKTQNNIDIFGFFHKKMILSVWLSLK